MPHTDFDPILRDFNEKMLQKAIDDRTKAVQAENRRYTKQAAKQRAGTAPPIVISDPPEATVSRAPGSRAAGRSWLDKAVLYTALVLAIVGFGLGFAATSLVGAVVGAAVGFAVPFGLRRAVEAVVDFIDENLPQLLALVAIMGLGAIGYFVLLS